jgi:hypothetical protein
MVSTKRNTALSVIAGLLAVTFCLLGTPAARAQTSTPPAGSDPFCAVQINRSGDVGWLVAHGHTVSARIVLVLDGDGVYALQTSKLPISGAQYYGVTPSFTIAASNHAATSYNHGYVYVDSYRIDGGAEVACVAETAGFPNWRPTVPDSLATDSPERQTFEATFQHALPALPCGRVYSPAAVRKAAEAEFPRELGSDATALILVFVDAQGHAAATRVYQSTGSTQADAFAADAASRATYDPEQFYCSPAAGLYLYSVKYEVER